MLLLMLYVILEGHILPYETDGTLKAVLQQGMILLMHRISPEPAEHILNR